MLLKKLVEAFRKLACGNGAIYYPNLKNRWPGVENFASQKMHEFPRHIFHTMHLMPHRHTYYSIESYFGELISHDPTPLGPIFPDKPWVATLFPGLATSVTAFNFIF